MDDKGLHERTVEQRTVLQGHYLTVRVDTVVDAEGQRHTRELVIHPGAVAMIPVLGTDVLMVRQFRTPAGQVLLELPAGTLDRAADGSVEDPDLAAARELGEETGFRAGRLQRLGSFYTAPGFASELMHLYLAAELTPIQGYQGPEPDEHLDLRRIPIPEALKLADDGGIHDAKTLVGLFWLARLMEGGRLGLTR
jgi:ADP-ribose diphosphatase